MNYVDPLGLYDAARGVTAAAQGAFQGAVATGVSCGVVGTVFGGPFIGGPAAVGGAAVGLITGFFGGLGWDALWQSVEGIANTDGGASTETENGPSDAEEPKHPTPDNPTPDSPSGDSESEEGAKAE